MLRRVVGLIEGLLEICGRMFVSICRMMGSAGWEGGREGWEVCKESLQGGREDYKGGRMDGV